MHRMSWMSDIQIKFILATGSDSVSIFIPLTAWTTCSKVGLHWTIYKMATRQRAPLVFKAFSFGQGSPSVCYINVTHARYEPTTTLIRVMFVFENDASKSDRFQQIPLRRATQICCCIICIVRWTKVRVHALRQNSNWDFAETMTTDINRRPIHCHIACYCLCIDEQLRLHVGMPPGLVVLIAKRDYVYLFYVIATHERQLV